MTCEDVVATGRYPYTGRFGMLTEKDREMIEYAMQVVHVYAFRNQDFQKISDGQRQRADACKSDLSGTGDYYFG